MRTIHFLVMFLGLSAHFLKHQLTALLPYRNQDALLRKN